MASIKDVAKLAGVNQAIVSRVINRDQTLMIKDSTRERVLSAIEELNYRPNMLGRNLRVNSTNTLGVFVPDIINPYFSELLLGVESAALEKGFHSVFFNTDDLPSKEADLMQTALEYHVDGFILASVTLGNSLLDILNQKQKPYVMVHRRFDEASGVYIGSDDNKGIGLLVEHLLSLGHRKIAYLSDTEQTYSGRQRKSAFLETMARHGIPVPDSYVVCCGNRLDDGYDAAMQLLENEAPPTAIVAYNDMRAIGAINAALSKGVSIPEELSIVGYDDIWMAGQMHPPLTTVRVAIRDLGYKAANELIRLIKSPEEERSKDIITDVSLIVRRSAGPCRE